MQCFVVSSDEIEGRLDCFFYSPKNQVSIKSKFPLVTVKDVTNNVIHPPEYKRIYAAYGYQLLRAQNVKPLGIEINSNKVFLDKDYLKGKKLISPEIGDVLVVRSGANTGDCAVIEKDYVDLILGADNLVCKCNDKINPFFLKTYLSLNIGRKILNLYQTGATNYHITPENLKKIKIPLPPLSIQNQIVDIMQSAFSRKKQMEAEAQRLLDSIDGYVLDEIGIKLPAVEDKRCFVVNSEEVRNRRLDTFYYKLEFIELMKLTKKGAVEFQPLESLTLKITDGSHFSPKNSREFSKKYITVKDLNGGSIDFENCYTIAEKDFNELVKNGCQPLRNEVLFSKDGTIGKTFLIGDYNDFVVLSSLAILRPNTEVIVPSYLELILKSKIVLKFITRLMGGSALQRIILDNLKKLLIPLPPLEIQNKIADEVKSRISDAERLKAGANKIIEEAKKQVEKMILGD